MIRPAWIAAAALGVAWAITGNRKLAIAWTLITMIVVCPILVSPRRPK